MTTECVAVGCDSHVDDDNRLACTRHWRMLPRFTKRAVDEARRTGAAYVGGKWHDVAWWEQRAAREINSAVINREAQLAGHYTELA